jgi:uncharacterized protein
MRRPFVLSVGEELRHPGVRTSIALVGPLPGVALSSAQVPDGADIHFDGVVEAQGAQIIVQGEVVAPWVGECRRCLRPTSGQVAVEVREVFEGRPVEGETYPLVDEQIDLEPVLRESLALSLPLAPLCREDCPGPDPEAHPVGVAVDEADVPQGRRDPRWDALDQLEFEGELAEQPTSRPGNSTVRPDDH